MRCSSPITPKWSSKDSRLSGRRKKSARAADNRPSPIVLRPVPLIFIEIRQRREIPHAIEKQHAVQVVCFVLNDASREIIGRDLDLSTRTIQPADRDGAQAR